MKLQFIIDKKYDYWMLYLALRKRDKTEFKNWAQKIRIKFYTLKNIIARQEKDATKFLERNLQKQYNRLLPYIRRSKQYYQKSWDEINDSFFKLTEKITGYSWRHKKYYCVLSIFHQGISSWGGNKIVRTWQENPYLMRKITAHELLISHIFTIFERDFKEENLTDKQKWALAEISAFAICGLEKKMLRFWPWISEEEEKYSFNHNYPELYKLQKILRPKYEKKKNFKEFFKESIKIIKRDRKILQK
jgi:hypothetical protein